MNALASLVDTVLDRSVVLGYLDRLGGALPLLAADPEPGSMVGKAVVTGATSGIGEAMARSFLDLGATVHLLGRTESKVADYAREPGGGAQQRGRRGGLRLRPRRGPRLVPTWPGASTPRTAGPQRRHDDQAARGEPAGPRCRWPRTCSGRT